MKLGLVMMASGFSERFGGNKLFYPVEGKTLMERAMDACPPTLFSRAVVVSQYDELLELAADRGYLPLPNLHPEEGQSESIRMGLSFLGDCAGVAFAVCDQPWLTRGSVKALIAAFRLHPEDITALSFAGQRGNPVIFPRSLFPELIALSGDVGGGAVIRAHPDRLRLVEVSSPRELEDLDTPL